MLKPYLKQNMFIACFGVIKIIMLKYNNNVLMYYFQK